jgi:hypothetical protein
MGARTWMIVISDGDPRQSLASRPALDRDQTSKVAAALFPKEKLEPLEDSSLMWTSPPDNEIRIGCFPGMVIVAAEEFAIDHPSKIPARFLEYAGSGAVHFHAMHSVVDWLAFAVWRNGKLERSLSLSPDGGIVEDIGQRLSFEVPYWDGAHPAVDPADMDDDEPPYPFPFHPLELGEGVLREFFGYHLEGPVDPSLLDPESIPLLCYKRKKSFFKLW